MLPESGFKGISAELSLMQQLTPTEPIRVSLSTNLIATLAIFVFLRDIRKYHFRITYAYPHTLEIVDRIRDHHFSAPPDICAIAMAPSSRMLRDGIKGYAPLMLLPTVSQCCLANIGDKQTPAGKPNEGRYLFLSETPSGPAFYFDALVRAGLADPERCSIEHTEPDEVPKLLNEEDPSARAISWFPHHAVILAANPKIRRVRVINDSGVEVRGVVDDYPIAGNLLFISEELHRNTQLAEALDIAVRDAWISLRDDTELLGSIIGSILSDDNYLACLIRFSGVRGKIGPSGDKHS